MNTDNTEKLKPFGAIVDVTGAEGTQELQVMALNAADALEKFRRADGIIITSDDTEVTATALDEGSISELDEPNAECGSEYSSLRDQIAELTKQRDVASKNLEMAVWRIKDMLMGDDGQAWKEAEKFLASLATQEANK